MGWEFLILASERNLTDRPVNQWNWEGLGRAGWMVGPGQVLAQSEAEGTCCPKKEQWIGIQSHSISSSTSLIIKDK